MAKPAIPLPRLLRGGSAMVRNVKPSHATDSLVLKPNYFVVTVQEEGCPTFFYYPCRVVEMSGGRVRITRYPPVALPGILMLSRKRVYLVDKADYQRGVLGENRRVKDIQAFFNFVSEKYGTPDQEAAAAAVQYPYAADVDLPDSQQDFILRYLSGTEEFWRI